MKHCYLVLLFICFVPALAVADCEPLQGDANGDCAVNFNDLNVVLANWGTTGPTGDINGNGQVDFNDLNIILANWGEACDPDCQIPTCP